MDKIDNVKIFIEYKGFKTELEKEEGFYCGEIEGVPELFYFEGKTIEYAIEDFKETVKLYMTLEHQKLGE